MSNGVNPRLGGERCLRSGAAPLRVAIRLALLAGLVAHAPLPADLVAVPRPPSIECTVEGRMVELPGGDQLADHEDHPWQVAVLRDGAYTGGGVLLGPEWVLTAGHLAEAANATASALAVGHPMHGEVNPRDFGRHAVAEVFVHPEYENGNPPKNDIALLRLADPFQVARTSYANLPLKSETGRLERSGTCAAVTRWEKVPSTVLDPSAPVGALRATNVRILSRKQCRAAYGKGEISAGDICAGEVAVTCQGSSGGALTVGSLPNRPRWLVGLVSWGEGMCGNPDAKPDVYARVSEYLDWIQQTMRGPTR